MSNNIGLSVVKGEVANAQRLADASKRNIGLLMTRERGPENYPILMSTYNEDQVYFGGYMADSYGHIVARNLFKNAMLANAVVYGVRIIGDGSVQASNASTLLEHNSPIITVMAGFRGRADKGTWGNNLTYRFYHKGVYQKGNWALLIYYKGVLVETWTATTATILQSNVNESSNYVTVDFSAEPVIANVPITNTECPLIAGSYYGTGTISNISAAIAETLAKGTVTVTGAGATNDVISIYVNGILLATYKKTASETVAQIATALIANLNLGTHGFTATSGGAGVVRITAPTGSGASINSAIPTVIISGTITATKANFGSGGSNTVGVDAVPAGISSAVKGVGTDFVTEASVGMALFTTSGQYIGTINSVGSTTTITLDEVAETPVVNQPFVIAPFAYKEAALTGGVYVAPTENAFYPVNGLSGNTGLAALDGYDVQIIANSEFHTLTMTEKMRDYCAGRQDCIAVVNTPFNAGVDVLQSFATSLQNDAENYVAGYNCWVKTSDDNGGTLYAPSIGCVLGAAYLRVPYLNGDFVHIPPGGTESYFIDVTEILPKLLTQQQLNTYTRTYTVNSVVFMKGKGFFVMTSRTYSTKDLYQSVHIIMQTNMYVKVLQNSFPWVLQQPSTPELKRQVYASLYAYFSTEYANAALERSVPFEEACVIICDQSNNPASQDRKELNADVLWIPTECTEAVKISLKRNDGVLLVKSIS